MTIYTEADYQSMCRRVANIISAQLIIKPKSVLGLATGSTPIGVYRQLAQWNQKGDLSFEAVTTVNLDEYIGLPAEHPQSYRHFMDENLFSQVDIAYENTHVPNGMAEDIDEECRRYDERIAQAGGVDLQLLGVGHNGHIAFNEPDNIFALGTHCVTLSERTIEANKRFFDNAADVPRQALTMGIKNIMRAKKIVVAVSGEDKAEIVKRAFSGGVSPECPASILQFHSDVILVGDEAALRLLHAV